MSKDGMTLEEAIKELKQDTEHPTADYLPKLKKAQQLGIEALERIKEFRERKNLYWPLPSEEA